MKALTELQRECFSNFLDDYPLVILSLADQPHPAHEVCRRAMELADLMETGDLAPPEEMCDLTKAIYQASVEKNDWLDPYEGQSDASRNRKPDQMRTIRECAAILEANGIEVRNLPI